jgi:hypothetical protein
MIGFEHPYYLLGLLTVVVPLLIFLFTRDRIRKVAFSTLRFFAGTSATMVQRKRWQEALLLAMRMAVCALLALAFARPLLQNRDGSQAGQLQATKAVALVVDVSASMARPGASEQARKLAAAAVDGLPGDAAVTLITFDRAPHVDLAWTRDLGEARGRIAALQPGAGGTDLVAAIRKADECLTQIVATERQIVVVSDLQRSGWESSQGSWKLHRGVKLDFQPVKPENSADAAIIAADVPQGIVNGAPPQAVTVRVANFSQEPIRDLPVRLVLGDKTVDTQKINLAAGDRVVVRFPARFEQMGDNRGTVKLGDGDSAAPGSVFYFNTRVIPKIDVRILVPDGVGTEPKSGATGILPVHSAGTGKMPVAPGEGSGKMPVAPGVTPVAAGVFFLQTALAPSADSPFVVVRTPAVAVTPAELAEAEVVVLADVDAAPPAVCEALGKVLDRGGGLLFLPGSSVQPARFARNFGDLAPCKLRRAIEAGEMRRGNSKAVLGKINLEHPVFEIFDRPHFGDFSAVRFDRYWEVTDSQLAHVAARFDDGRPFLLEKSLRGGSSILLASPVDMAWNNLAHRAVFLPLVHQLVRCLAQRTERPTAYTIGDGLPVPPQGSLRDPSGKVCQGGSVVADQCGFYSVLDAGGKTTLTYAINGDLAETNPATVDAVEIAAALEPAAGSAETPVGLAALAAVGGREIWSWLVAALLVLTMMELSLGNRVARH